MKGFFKKFNALSILVAGSFLFINNSIAQKNGILPLTGMKFFNEGIGAKLISVRVDGAQLMSNRIPLNKEIEIRLQQPTGFTADNNKTMFAGAEVIVLTTKGEVLLKDQNALYKNYPNGFYEKDLNNFSIKFGIGTDIVKGNFAGILKIRLYDMKAKSQLRLESAVSFAKPGEAFPISKTVKPIRRANHHFCPLVGVVLTTPPSGRSSTSISFS